MAVRALEWDSELERCKVELGWMKATIYVSDRKIIIIQKLQEKGWFLSAP